jgi:predicted nucleic acid-binding protein
VAAFPAQRPDPRLLHRRAAALYARCRWSGFTPRSGNDCLIAGQAIESREPLLHDDRDFVRMEAVEPALGRWLLPVAGRG